MSTMTKYTTAQLEAIVALFPEPLFLAHYGGDDDCYVITDGANIAIGGATIEVANALMKSPDLARLVLEKDAEIARLKAALKTIANANGSERPDASWDASTLLRELRKLARQAMKETIKQPMTPFNPTTPIDEDYDVLMTVEEYFFDVKGGAIIDYDGYGHPATKQGKDTSIRINPSEGKTKIPSEATHIVWYNR